MLGAAKHQTIGRPPRRRRPALVAALALTLAATGCAASVDISELRIAAEAQYVQTVPPLAPAPPPATKAPTTSGPTGCAVQRCLSVVVTGDVLLHPPLVEQAERAGATSGRDLDFVPMLAAMEPWVAPADLAVCHLETPLAPEAGPFIGYPEFSVPPQILDGLVTTGFDACTTASNHTLDQGPAGLIGTLDDLDAAGIAHDGSFRSAAEAQTPTVVTTAAGQVGLISVTYGLNTGEPDEPWMVSPLDPAAIIAKAERARAAGAELVIVAVHAGVEYETEPNSDQVSAFTELLESPAIDLVYGHHAHVVQPLERINGKWAIYGLGNLIAAHETPIDQTHEGLLVRVTFEQGSDGQWTTSDVGWVPSLQDRAAPFNWCALGAGTVCSSAEVDRIALERTTAAVNLLGAAQDGAHPLTGG